MNKLKKLKKKIKDSAPFLIIFFLIFAFFFVYFFNYIVFTINPGEGGVLFRRFSNGTVMDKVYGEGVQVVFPWDKLYIYNVRVQEVHHEFDVLTINGLKVHLSISTRYYPEYKLLPLLHQKVGPNYVNILVLPEIEQVLRIIIGQLDAEEVYTTKRAILEKTVNEATEQLAQRFVNLDDVIIKKMSLPLKIEEAIQRKIEQKHIAKAYVFILQKEEQEALRKKIEAQGIKAYNETVASSITKDILQWEGIRATLEISKSDNSKVIVIGGGKRGLPIIGNIPMENLENTTAPPPP